MNIIKQNHVKYGLILCVVIAVCLLSMELTGKNESFEQASPIFIFGQMIAPAFIWYMGMDAKKKMQKGKLTYKQAFIEGVKISLVFAIVSPFVFVAYYLLINPAIVDSVRETYMMSTSTAQSMVIAVDMAVQFISAMVFGTIYSAIIAFFVKSK
ncbi:MAG: DUF4199 domain-containing protein [Weeksellaceae bacterium]